MSNSPVDSILSISESPEALVCLEEESSLDTAKRQIEALSRRLETLGAEHSSVLDRFSRLGTTLKESENQLQSAQKQLTILLKEGEDRLRWGTALDVKLHKLKLVLEERELSLRQLEQRNAVQKAQLDQYGSNSEELKRLQDKVLRMQNSPSWKLTAPLRFLRRMIVDRFTR